MSDSEGSWTVGYDEPLLGPFERVQIRHSMFIHPDEEPTGDNYATLIEWMSSCGFVPEDVEFVVEHEDPYHSKSLAVSFWTKYVREGSCALRYFNQQR